MKHYTILHVRKFFFLVSLHIKGLVAISSVQQYE